jgi:hypothetical protein
MAREHGTHRETVATPVSRRHYLKATGFLVGSMAASSVVAENVSANAIGYGASGYGESRYGGSSIAPTVALTEIRNVTESSATFAGELTALGTADSVTVSFQWRKAGTEGWTTTKQTSVSRPSTYTATVTELSPDTTYEVRPIAVVGSELTTGEALTTTTAATETPPTIAEFEISKSEQLGDDRMFSVQWAVKDANHDLDTVEVVVAESPLSFNFAVTDVSGTTASGWEMFQFPIGSNLEVTLRVTDGRGDVTRTKKTITL